MQAPPHCTWEARQEVAQAPLAQTSPWLQSLPALGPAQSALAPQKARSVSGLTQPPPQKSWPAGQEGAQRPAWQISPGLQLLPALGPAQSPLAPQKERSVSGLTQVPPVPPLPPHSTWPARHEGAQAPPVQTSPSGQTVPAFGAAQSARAPQWLRSVSGLTQAPPQLTCPVGQLTEHPPEAQTWPTGQTLPAVTPAQSALAPHQPRSVFGSTHPPLHSTCPG